MFNLMPDIRSGHIQVEAGRDEIQSFFDNMRECVDIILNFATGTPSEDRSPKGMVARAIREARAICLSRQVDDSAVVENNVIDSAVMSEKAIRVLSMLDNVKCISDIYDVSKIYDNEIVGNVFCNICHKYGYAFEGLKWISPECLETLRESILLTGYPPRNLFRYVRPFVAENEWIAAIKVIWSPFYGRCNARCKMNLPPHILSRGSVWRWVARDRSMRGVWIDDCTDQPALTLYTDEGGGVVAADRREEV